MTLAFAFTLFASATLLFLVQPMSGKGLLPLVGGTPATWNTCLVFFQAVLLLGYWYADRLGRLAVRVQWRTHLAVSALGIAAAVLLSPDADWIPADRESPVLHLLAYLAAAVGAPFFVLSATAPLLQRWFHAARQRDPYFLYAASNAGSFVGLLGYPLLVEPRLPLDGQRWAWTIGFVGVGGLVAACGFAAIRRSRSDSNTTPAAAELVKPGRVWKWIALAALPSSLLLASTAHLTTDIAPIPLVWVVPLALYLLSFVVVFARWPNRARLRTGRMTAMALVCLCVVLIVRATEPLPLIAGIELATLLLVCLLCLGELAHDRPGPAELTRFYLALSVGGVLGGLFNVLLAPLLFARLGLVEYPLALLLVALVRPTTPAGLERLVLTRRDALLLVGLASLAVGMVLLLPEFVPFNAPPGSPEEDIERLIRGGLLFGLPAVATFALAARPLRFALGLAVVFAAAALDPGPYGRPLHTTRNFFGTLRVVRSPDGKFTRLVHGTTLHGQQWADRPGHPEPLMYYHRRGPVGQLLTKLPAERRQRVGVVGLGCGALAAYAAPGEAWTFFEIDPAVARIAEDTRYFTFLSTCRGTVEIDLGDARRRLADYPDGAFDVLVLDAFSSDAIPVHLLTREAFALYARKLTPTGVIAFHISNRYLDLPPLVAGLAADHSPAWTARVWNDASADPDTGRFASVWAVAARDPAALSSAGVGFGWESVPVGERPVWTDSFSDLLGSIKRDD